MVDYLGLLIILDGIEVKDIEGYIAQSDIKYNIMFKKRIFSDYIESPNLVSKDINSIRKNYKEHGKDSIIFLENSWLTYKKLPEKFDGFGEKYISDFTDCLLIYNNSDMDYYEKLKKCDIIKRKLCMLENNYFDKKFYLKKVSDDIISFYKKIFDENII